MCGDAVRDAAHLQVDNFPKFAEVLVELADVVQPRRYLPNGQLRVRQRKRQRKRHFLMEAVMVGLVEVWPLEKKGEKNYISDEKNLTELH